MKKLRYEYIVKHAILYMISRLYKEGQTMDLNIGDIVKLKKQHPCGSSEWEILRSGMDFRLKCLGCGHLIMLPRKQLEKSVRQVRKPQ